MTTRRFVGVTVAAALGVLAFAGTASAVSEKQYRKQVNALCDTLEAARTPLLPASGTSVYSRKDTAAATAYATAAVPLYRALTDDVDALKPPKSLAEHARAFVMGLDAASATIHDDPMAAFSPLANPFRAAYEASKKLGTKSCDTIAAQRL